jgi:glyoxylase-like metal-dependent hydrolase (beta-lactamase superfamily II)
MQEFAPDVAHLPILFVNVYFVGAPNEDWILVDTGLPGSAQKIKDAAQERYGSTPPRAIILTHGHFDHASNARELAEFWNVPIYAHRLEIPFLNGHSNYPPRDPTVGGAIAFMSRFMPSRGLNLGPQLRALEGDELEIPELPGWKILFAPGHAPGHIALWREGTSTLLAGDAFATEDMDSWTGMLTMQQKVSRAGAPFNCDWNATRDSVKKLAALRPKAVGCGHGAPISEQDNSLLADDLEIFAEEFPLPEHGRYANQPAQTDERGVLFVPPPAPDPFLPIAAGASLAAMAVWWLRRRGSK